MAAAGEDIEAAQDALRRAAEATDEDTRTRRLEEAIAILQMATKERATADDLYLLGYAEYLHRASRAPGAMREASKRALAEAVKAKPDHAEAHLYLGHHAYDEGRYEDARAEFAAAKFDAADGERDGYLEAKRREILVCCEIQLKGLAGALDELDKFTGWLEKQSVYDVHPINLVRLFESRSAEIASVEEDVRTRLAELATRIDRAGHFRDWLAGVVSQGR